MDLLKKLQALPEFQRKIIFWTIFILVAFLALSFWIIRAKERLENFPRGEFFKEIKPSFTETEDSQIQELQQDFEELNKLKQTIEEIEKQEIEKE